MGAGEGGAAGHEHAVSIAPLPSFGDRWGVVGRGWSENIRAAKRMGSGKRLSSERGRRGLVAHLVTVSTAAGSGGVGGKEERRETAGDRDRLRPGVQVPKGAASQTAVV